jgi:membrane-associated phospholipid phosphatase
MEFLTGYAVFRWIATWANPFCDVFFRAVTDFGDHTFYYLAIAALFWLADRRRAGTLLLLLLVSGYVNTFAKLWMHTPRPNADLVRVLDFRPYQFDNYAFPSGHAQNAVVFWCCLASWVRRGWFSGLAVVAVLLISFSRLYLGVHFPIDIVGGLCIGGIVILVLPRVFERWSYSNFRLPGGGMVALAGVCLTLVIASGDPSVAALSGSLIGFMAGAVWLPQSPLVFRTVWQSSAGVTAGLLVLVASAVALQRLPHDALMLFAQVTALWIVALWLYPHALRRMWLSPAKA